MNKLSSVVVMACLAAVVSGCAGRAAKPVRIVEYRDHKLTCQQVQDEITMAEAKIVELKSEENTKRAQNTAAGIGGALLIVPLFAMDFQDAAGTERLAYEQRVEHLQNVQHEACAHEEIETETDERVAEASE